MIQFHITPRLNEHVRQYRTASTSPESEKENSCEGASTAMQERTADQEISSSCPAELSRPPMDESTSTSEHPQQVQLTSWGESNSAHQRVSHFGVQMFRCGSERKISKIPFKVQDQQESFWTNEFAVQDFGMSFWNEDLNICWTSKIRSEFRVTKSWTNLLFKIKCMVSPGWYFGWCVLTQNTPFLQDPSWLEELNSSTEDNNNIQSSPAPPLPETKGKSNYKVLNSLSKSVSESGEVCDIRPLQVGCSRHPYSTIHRQAAVQCHSFSFSTFFTSRSCVIV